MGLGNEVHTGLTDWDARSDLTGDCVHAEQFAVDAVLYPHIGVTKFDSGCRLLTRPEHQKHKDSKEEGNAYANDSPPGVEFENPHHYTIATESDRGIQGRSAAWEYFETITVRLESLSEVLF